MAQKKLKRFNEIKSFPNVFEYPENMNGNWSSFFKNHNPIVLELGCGKGEYTIGLAELYPNQNYIGVDIKGNRIWAGAKAALENNYKNVAFLRTHIDKIDTYFDPDEIKEVWLTFPDPQLRMSRAKKRLTHPKYLRLYQKNLIKNGMIHLKTDSKDLYSFTKEVIHFYNLNIIEDSSNIYQMELGSPALKIQTHYEKLNISKSNKMFYLCFQLTENLDEHFRDLPFNEHIKKFQYHEPSID